MIWGNFLKISVGCQNREPMLHGAGGNPDIVACDRSSAFLEERCNDGPSIRGFIDQNRPRYRAVYGSFPQAGIDCSEGSDDLVERVCLFLCPGFHEMIEIMVADRCFLFPLTPADSSNSSMTALFHAGALLFGSLLNYTGDVG